MSVSRADDGNWTVLTALAAAYDAFRFNYIALVATTLVWLLPAIALDVLGVGRTTVAMVECLTAVLLTMGLAPAIAESLLGHPVPILECLRLSVRRVRLSSLLLALILLFSLPAAFVLLIVPGLWLLAAWSVAAPAQVAEQLTPTTALSRSMGLARGRLWRIGITMVIFAFIVFFLTTGTQVLLVAIAGSADTGVARPLGWLVDAIFMSLGACLTTVLYCLLRFDKEGITLELVTDSLH